MIGERRCPNCGCMRKKHDFTWERERYNLCNSCRFDEIKKKLNEKELKPLKPKKAPLPVEYEDGIFLEQITSDANIIKREGYVIPGVDEISLSTRFIAEKFLSRPTTCNCPRCNGILYNTRLDGKHYYCPICNVQWKQ